MLRHRGNSRTFNHNIQLAAILSFIAGMVNISGVLSIKILTTNITGHFAFFSEELVFKNYINAFIFLLFILSFLLGSFVANILVEFVSRVKPFMSHTIPLLVEALLLAFTGIYGFLNKDSNLNEWGIAAVLLFAMGIQNSSVTHISQAKVRTTHLTGLFTDLGIELSQLFFYKQATDREILSKSIYLKLIIILFFFFGCIIGGFLYNLLDFITLLIASACLLVALFYDTIRFKFYYLKEEILK